MKSPKLSLQTLRLKNFKAVRDSGPIEFTPFTVFIGNNGSGKSRTSAHSFTSRKMKGLVAWRKRLLTATKEKS